MSVNMLKINAEKTEVLFIGTQHQLDKHYLYLNEAMSLASVNITHVTEVEILVSDGQQI